MAAGTARANLDSMPPLRLSRFQSTLPVRGATGNGICDSTFALNNAITTEGRNLSSQLANCCCEQRLGIANLSAQMNQNTCDITTAIHAEAEATRSLIQANEMQALRDKVSSLEMDNRMYGVVRYPNGYTYNAGNSPFCGNNCGCCC